MIGFILGFVAGAVVCYFFMRNNPAKAAVVNSAVASAKAALPVIPKV